MNTRKLPTSS